MQMSATAQQIGMPAGDYFAAPGLSNSGMKDLAVSPLRYWFRHINPNRPIVEPSREMVIGSALHCAVLETAEYDSRYAVELNPPSDCLETIEDLRTWLKDHSVAPKGTRKADIMAQVQAVDPDVPILEIQKQRHAEAHKGKTILSIEEWNRVAGMTEALVRQPVFKALLAAGESEQSIFVTDPDTGVPLKARMDWVTPTLTLDLKTFAQKRGKSIDKSVADAIWYEQYYRQAYFYTYVRGIQAGEVKGRHPDFIMAFVESEEPHEVRIKSLRPMTAGEVNLYWDRARLEVRDLIQAWAEYMERFGDKPWRTPAAVEPLIDQDMPGLAY